MTTRPPSRLCMLRQLPAGASQPRRFDALKRVDISDASANRTESARNGHMLTPRQRPTCVSNPARVSGLGRCRC